jgi:hypothetical protein
MSTPPLSASPRITIYDNYSSDFSKDFPLSVATLIEQIRDQSKSIAEIRGTLDDMNVQITLLKELYELTRKETIEEMWKKLTPAILSIDKRCSELVTGLASVKSETSCLIQHQLTISKKLDHLEAK